MLRSLTMVAMIALALLAQGEEESRELFNGKDLSGWYTYFKGRGRNNDPKGVVTVKNGILRISGEEWGAVVTEEEFSDYRLDVEYRFTGTRYGDKQKKALDSGILFHSTGPDGAFYGIWLYSHEYNLITGASGDIWTVGDERARPDMVVEGESDETFTDVSLPEGSLRTHAIWKEGGRKISLRGNRRLCRRDIPRNWTDTPDAPIASNEYPTGEWNTATLVCRGESVECWFNGLLVNKATRVVPSRGKIQLQSEGCGIEFRRVTIRSLKATSCDGEVADFEAARPVWPKDEGKTMNSHFRFTTTFDAGVERKALLRVTAGYDYKAWLNGEFVSFGPARCAPGRFRVDEWPLKAKAGENVLEIDVAGYNCNNFYLPDQTPFLQAEVVAGGKVVARTGLDGEFLAHRTGRVRKVPRFSYQRTFAEVYRIPHDADAALPLDEQPPKRLLPRKWAKPDFHVVQGFEPVSLEHVRLDASAKLKQSNFIVSEQEEPNGDRSPLRVE